MPTAAVGSLDRQIKKKRLESAAFCLGMQPFVRRSCELLACWVSRSRLVYLHHTGWIPVQKQGVHLRRKIQHVEGNAVCPITSHYINRFLYQSSDKEVSRWDDSSRLRGNACLASSEQLQPECVWTDSTPCNCFYCSLFTLPFISVRPQIFDRAVQWVSL